jgi:acylphosphatase
MTSDQTALRAIVHGRVQGVGFRFYVLEVATGLGLTGYVRNRPEGTVEVEAEGTRESLELLLVELRRGPSLSRVERVTESWSEPTGAFTGFDVR